MPAQLSPAWDEATESLYPLCLALLVVLFIAFPPMDSCQFLLRIGVCFWIPLATRGSQQVLASGLALYPSFVECFLSPLAQVPSRCHGMEEELGLTLSRLRNLPTSTPPRRGLSALPEPGKGRG